MKFLVLTVALLMITVVFGSAREAYGDIFLFYKDGQDIIVKKCETKSAIEASTNQIIETCTGTANKVSVESFKQNLRNVIYPYYLGMLTSEEMKAYEKKGFSSDQVNNMKLELERINIFILVFGARYANLPRRIELLYALHVHQVRERAIQKVNVEVEKVLKQMTDQKQLVNAKYHSYPGDFFYSAFAKFALLKSPCGLKGSIEERVKSCASELTSEKEQIVLVTRTKGS